MSYPEDPPVPVSEFSHRDPAQLAAMYQWAGSAGKLAEWLRAQGYSITDSALTQWRRRYGIEIAQRNYRCRKNAIPPLASAYVHTDVEQPEPEPEPDHIGELLEYLQTRTVPKGVPPAASRSGKKYSTALIGCDVHYPHHHEAAFEVFLGLADMLQPDEITLNGDTWDFSQLGRYSQKPTAVRQLQADIDECRENVLARITAAAPHSRRRLVLGNHEMGRYLKYLWDRCPQLASLRCLDMEALLGLSEMGWVYQPDGYWLTDALYIDHGDRHTSALGGGSAMSARKEMLDVGSSGCSGHTHKLGLFLRLDRVSYRVWAEGGCLCDQFKMREAGVTTRKRGLKVEDWHPGCLKVEYHAGGDAFAITPIPILESHERTFAIVDGEEVAA